MTKKHGYILRIAEQLRKTTSAGLARRPFLGLAARDLRETCAGLIARDLRRTFAR